MEEDAEGRPRGRMLAHCKTADNPCADATTGCVHTDPHPHTDAQVSNTRVMRNSSYP